MTSSIADSLFVNERMIIPYQQKGEEGL